MPHEAGLLQLDSSKARLKLGWQPVWDFETAVHRTASWYRRWLEDGEVASNDDLSSYAEGLHLSSGVMDFSLDEP